MKSLTTLALAIAASALFAGTAMAAPPEATKCTGEADGGIVKSVKVEGDKLVMSFRDRASKIRVPLSEKKMVAELSKVKPGTLYCVEPDPLM